MKIYEREHIITYGQKKFCKASQVEAVSLCNYFTYNKYNKNVSQTKGFSNYSG